MLTFLGILLTEIKLFGVPLRAPLLVFIPTTAQQLKVAAILVLIALGGYVVQLGSAFDGIEKTNELVMIVIFYGFFYFVISSPRPFALKDLQVYVVGSLFFLLAISALQFVNLFPFTDRFLMYYKDWNRTSGLSGEPSFFAVMFFYLWILAYSFNLISRSYLVVGIALAYILSRAHTFIELFTILAVCHIFFSSRVKNWKYSAVILVLFFPCAYYLIDLIYFQFTEQRVGEYLLLEHASWRHLSHYSAMFSANILDVPNLGTTWHLDIQDGQQNYINRSYWWLIWPWNFFSVLILEFGILLALVISIVVLTFRFRKYHDQQLKVGVATLFLCGLFITPKWAVYYFFFPVVSDEVESKRVSKYLRKLIKSLSH